MKINTLFYRVLFALLPFQLFAQDNGCVQSLSYDVEEQRFYELPNLADISNITELDKVKLRKTIERKHVEICIDPGGDINIETTLLNPEEVYENWMTKVIKTITNKEGVKMYNPAGSLIYNELRSETSAAVYEANKAATTQNSLGALPTFSPLTLQQIQLLQGEGMTVEVFEKGAKIVSGNRETYYDFQGKFIEIKNFNEDELKSTVLRKYKTNTDGDVDEPDFFITKTRKSLYGGVCVDYIKFEKFSNYRRGVGSRENDSSISSGLDENVFQFNAFPNPVTHSFKIQIPPSINQSDANARIINSFGTIVAIFSKLKPGIMLEVPADTWASGIYLIQVEIEGKLYQKRFFKQ